MNLLIAVALGWSAASRARVGMCLAVILVVPGLATVATIWAKLHAPLPPNATALSVTALGALAVNLSCAFLLARHRRTADSLTSAAFLSARNDAIANIATITAGLATAWLWRSAWPDLIVGVGIAVLNADAAREVWTAARVERRTAA